jgi:hypothetical protein
VQTVVTTTFHHNGLTCLDDGFDSIACVTKSRSFCSAVSVHGLIVREEAGENIARL